MGNTPGARRAQRPVVCRQRTAALIVALLFGAGSIAAPAPVAAQASPSIRGGEASTPRASATLRLNLALFDGADLAEATLGLLREEVEAIFAAAGVEVGWLDRVNDPGRVSAHPEIRVILAPRPPAAWGLGERVMGTVLGSGYPRAAVYVFYPAVARTISRLPFDPGPGFEPSTSVGEGRRIALAIARVMAHEIIHTLSPGEPHARRGLMKRRLDVHDLLATHSTIDERFRRAFVTGVLDAARAQRLVIAASEGGGR